MTLFGKTKNGQSYQKDIHPHKAGGKIVYDNEKTKREMEDRKNLEFKRELLSRQKRLRPNGFMQRGN